MKPHRPEFPSSLLQLFLGGAWCWLTPQHLLGTHMCAADAFQQEPGNLSLTVKFALGNSHFLFRLKTEHGQGLVQALCHTCHYNIPPWCTTAHTNTSITRLSVWKGPFLCRSLLGSNSNCLLVSEMLRTLVHSKQLSYQTPTTYTKERHFFASSITPTITNEAFTGTTPSAPGVLSA